MLKHSKSYTLESNYICIIFSQTSLPQTHPVSNDFVLPLETPSPEAAEDSGRSSDELEEANGFNTDKSPAVSTDPVTTLVVPESIGSNSGTGD